MNTDSSAGKSPLPGVSEEDFDRNRRAYTDIVANYYGNPEFRARLEANPVKVLTEAGLQLPEGADVKLLFNTQEVLHLVLPGADAKEKIKGMTGG